MGELLTRGLIGATTPKYSNVRLGVKGTQALNLLDSTPTFQAGACSLLPSGTTQYTQHYITTCPETLFEQLCYKDLYATYQSMLMNPGQTSETVPFEQQLAELKVKQIQQRIESQLWNAKTSALGGTDCFNGLKTLISTNTGNTFYQSIGNSSGHSFSASAAYGTTGNPITEIDMLVNTLSANALSREDLVIYMSYSNFRLYVQALTKANFFQNYIGSTDITSNMEATHPNTNIKVVPTIGLNGSNQITIGPKEYTVVGFDLLSDHEKLDLWYSKDFDSVRMRANYNYGVTIATFTNNFYTNDYYFATNGLS